MSKIGTHKRYAAEPREVRPMIYTDNSSEVV